MENDNEKGPTSLVTFSSAKATKDRSYGGQESYGGQAREESVLSLR